MQGPLTMNPPADDNYGCSYSSLICLPTTPITLAMATQTGTVHHCLVLPSQEEDIVRIDLFNFFVIFDKH